MAAMKRFGRFCWLDECLAEPLFPPDEVRVFLTVSPVAKSRRGGRITQRQIQLNWSHQRPADGDRVGLYDADPSAGPAAAPLVSVAARDHGGFYQTEVQLGFPESVTDRSAAAREQCLGYWIAYVRANDGAVLAVDCLRTRPTWMRDHGDVLGDVAVADLLLPGTHNSGSYRHYHGRRADSVLARYLICQEEDVWSQLVYGVRYLDLRVGHYPDLAEPFWLNHNYARIHPLSVVVADLRDFLLATAEVVVVDVHRFPVGFHEPSAGQVHRQLALLLERELGSFMAPADQRDNATLNQLWAAKKTLIVAYADTATRRDHPLLWPSIPQEWGDKRTVADLLLFLEAAHVRRAKYPYLWAAMAELTPSALDVVLRPNEGLRTLAAASNRNVSDAFGRRWWSRANIAAVDFFQSTDIVDVAVRANVKRAQCAHPRLHRKRSRSKQTTTSTTLADAPSGRAAAEAPSLFQRLRSTARSIKTSILQSLPRFK